MRELLEKLKKLEVDISEEKGPFRLFALFLRENAPDVWDLVAAASWIDEDESAALRYLAAEVQRRLSGSEIVQLSGIVLIETDNPALKKIQRAFKVEHGMLEAKDSTFFGLPIRQAYFITSQRREAA